MVESNTTNDDPKPVTPMLKINIVEQIEYYFGDFNLIKDKYLQNEILKDEGWVPISTLLRFNRLAALSKDVNVILDAFKENTSTLVEVDLDRKSVRRTPQRPIPEHDETWKNSVAQRTVYVKGFPIESTLDEILKFMQTFGKIDNVYKRSYQDKALKQWKFKGSVYVAFPTREDAAKFMDIGCVKYAGNELIKRWQSDYIELKKNERLEKKLKNKERKDALLQEQLKAGMKQEKMKLPLGALISLTGLSAEINIPTLKTHLTQTLSWDIAFIERPDNGSNAYVRLTGENSAKEAIAKLKDNAFELSGSTITAELVEGDKETELLEKMEADKNSRLMKCLLKKKTGGKRGQKRKFGRGDRNDRNSEDRKDVKPQAAGEMDVPDNEAASSNSNVDSNASNASAEASALKRKTEKEDTTDGKSEVKKPKTEPKE